MALQNGDVLSLRAFFTLCYRKLDLLTFGEGLETAAVDRAEVYEYIRTALRGDEAETFGFIEPFNGASSGV